MLSDQRREVIVREARDTGFAHASELAARLGVSRATVWRDIDRLARLGMVAKVHGGAASPTGRLSGAPGHGRGVPSDLIIGMQVPTGDYYYRAVADGARAVCESFDARLVVEVSGYADRSVELGSIESLIGIGAHGLLLTPSAGSHWRSGISPKFLGQFAVPFVLLERDLAGLGGTNSASVTTAHESGIYAAVEHLTGLGHRHVGLVTIATQSRTRERIRDGFREAAVDFDLVGGPDGPWIREARGAIPELLAAVRLARMTAVVVFGDTLAVALAHQARAEAWRVPEDLSIVSYDDEVVADALPPLSAISPRRAEVGRIATNQLLTHLSGGEQLSGRRTQVEPHLVLRESTAPPER